MGTRNSIRYRGYYFDTETEFYCLGARYYCPEWRRFISPDATSNINTNTVNGLNLYVYAHNNPVGIKHIAIHVPSLSDNMITPTVSAQTGQNSSNGMVVDLSQISNVVSTTVPSPIVRILSTEAWKLGLLSYTVSVQMNNNAPLYWFENNSNNGKSMGFGYDYGLIGGSVYMTSDGGVGLSRQFLWLTRGIEFKDDSLVFSFGRTAGNLSGELSIEMDYNTAAGVAVLIAGTILSIKFPALAKTIVIAILDWLAKKGVATA